MKKHDSGQALLLTLMFVPIFVVLAVTVCYSISFGSGYALRTQNNAKAFYLAESGINIAYRLFQSRNFSEDTHEPGGEARDSNDPRLLTDPDPALGLTLDSDGWYVWKWQPGDPRDLSYTRSGRAEEFRFKISRPTSGSYRIECRALVGATIQAQVLEGELSSMFDFAVFDNGHLTDFCTSSDQVVTGNIHANGDIYVKPFEVGGAASVAPVINPLLNLTVDSLEAGGKIIRHKDFWGIEDNGSTVRITTESGDTALMEGETQGYVGPGNAYDSFSPDWSSDGSESALARWGGSVVDGSHGVQTRQAPLLETFQPGGFYDRRAGLKVDALTTAPWLSDVSFFNHSEGRTVALKEIDVAALAASGAWPDNGLLYSSEPIRLVNGQELVADLTVVSSSTVYVKGDYNKKFPTESAATTGVPTHKKAAILTPDRIYRLTSTFDDNAELPSVIDQLMGTDKASDPPLHSMDENNALEVNGALVDGVPPSTSRAWIEDEDNPFYVEGTGVMGMDMPVKQVDFSGLIIKMAYPQSEAFLENLLDVRLVGEGSVGHLRIAEMAEYDNSNAVGYVTPWLVFCSYVTPAQNYGDSIPGRTLHHDSRLSHLEHSPMVARRVRWHRSP